MKTKPFHRPLHRPLDQSTRIERLDALRRAPTEALAGAAVDSLNTPGKPFHNDPFRFGSLMKNETTKQAPRCAFAEQKDRTTADSLSVIVTRSSSGTV